MIFTVWCTEIKLNHTLISHGYDSIGMFWEKVMISQDQVSSMIYYVEISDIYPFQYLTMN